MDELEKIMPDDFWRKAFDEASETPPPRVWDTIEHRLNESDGTKILPLWGNGLASSRPLVWSMGIAASVALVLLGWWLLPTAQKTESVAIAHQKVRNSHITLPATETSPNLTADTPMPTDQSTALAQKPVERNLTRPTVPDRPSSAPTLAVQSSHLLAQLSRNLSKSVPENRPSEASKLVLPGNAPSENRYHALSAAFRPTNASFPDGLPRPTSASVAFEPVLGKTFRTGRYGQIHRIVWFRPAELPVAPEKDKSKRKMRDVWASASLMPVAFNPMVSLQTTAYSSNYVANDMLKTNQSSSASGQSVSSRPNFSMAYQASVGVQLSDRWSIESGVGYLLGRSTVETPAQLPAAAFSALIAHNAASTQYTDALRNSIYSNSANSPALTNTPAAYVAPTYTGQTSQFLTNDYQYVQVPVQVGYQLRLRKKLTLAVLGGLITNIFVKNTVGNEVIVTAKDGIYRPVSLAAIVGARFRYRPSQQWSASLAGVYQPSLGLGTQTDSQVQSRPTSAGMSLGVDYHF